MHKVLYAHLLYMSAAKGIEPIALRLRSQSLAAELSASAFTQCFTELGIKTTEEKLLLEIVAWQLHKKSLLRLFLALVAASNSD